MIDRSRGWLAAHYRSVQRATGRWATPTWLLIGLVALIGVTSLAGFLLAWMSPSADGGLDLGVTEWAAAHRTDALTTFFSIVTDVGDTITLLILSVVVGIAWRLRRGDWAGVEVLAGSYLGALVVYSAVKRIVGRGRPPMDLAISEVPGLAFPSGHTTGSAAVYTALVLLVIAMVRREAVRIGIVVGAGVLVVAIAASRVYLGAHWLADVVAGLFVGVTWAFWVVTPLYVRRRQRGEPVTEEQASHVEAQA